VDASRASSLVDRTWNDSVVPALVDYVRIPARSPAFDPDWRTHGHLARAVDLVASWCRAQPVPGLTVEVHELPGRTPVILMETPGDVDDTVLLYGHLDKQPEMTGWATGLGPWTPVLKDGRLYGRGGADDGYAAFAAITALAALADQGVRRARCVVLIEASEESGSPDLPAPVQALSERIGNPSLVVCLDSGCGTYDRLWCTTSLRGLAAGTLTVEILEEGVHSGDAGGIVPSTFRLARRILDRLEDAATGQIRPSAFHVDVPTDRRWQARDSARAIGSAAWQRFPWVPGAQPASTDEETLVLARTWRPSLEITGAAGLPAPADAGNVLRPRTTLKLSLRLPPTCDATVATRELTRVLTADPPNGARVTFQREGAARGWNAPPTESWLEKAIHAASRETFGRDAAFMGEGGTIPFMAMLGERFPEAQFLVTGVLGPGSNAHGPNEFLDLATARHVTSCVARVLTEHGTRGG